jgi:hypothetical protein
MPCDLKPTALALALALALAIAPAGLCGDSAHSLSLGFEALSGGYDNAKFNEYKDSQAAQRYLWGLAVGSDLADGADLSLVASGVGGAPDAGNAMAAELSGLADLGLHLGKSGAYSATVDWSRLEHQFADVRTIYDAQSVGSGHLVLNQGAAALLKGETRASISAKMLAALSGSAQTVQLGLTRDRLKAGLALVATEHSTLSVSVDDETRKGSRPIGQSLNGTTDAVEVMEPIDDRSTDLGFKYDYKRERVYSSASYHHNEFVNANADLQYDNPFNVGADTNLGSPKAATYTALGTIGWGAHTGMASLAPSNVADSVSEDMILTLPAKTRVEGKGSYSSCRQNAPFLPFTSNAYLLLSATAYGAMAAPSQGSLKGEVDSATGGLYLQNDALKALRLKASCEYWEHDNRDPAIVTDTIYINADDAASGTTWTSRVMPVCESWTEVKNGVGARWRAFAGADLSGSYWHDIKGYSGGLASRLTEDGGKLGLDGALGPGLGWHLQGERSSREADDGGQGVGASNYRVPSNILNAAGDLALDRMFFQASRDHDAANGQVDLLLGGCVTAVLGYTLDDDWYRATQIGLLDDSTQDYSVDVDLQVNDWLSVDPSYIYEQRSSDQRNDSSPAAGFAADPAGDPNAWVGREFDTTQTIALSANMALGRRTLFLDVGGAYSETHGQMGFLDNLKGAGAWAPDDMVSDQSRSLNLSAQATYKVSQVEGLRLGLGYQYASFSYDDYMLNGQPLFNTNAGAYNSLTAIPTKFMLVLDSQPQAYVVSTWMASADYDF